MLKKWKKFNIFVVFVKNGITLYIGRWLYEIIKEKGYISTNILVELQSMIEPNKTGIRKTLGTNLVNNVSGEIIYTPPQTENEIRNLLKNLENYINNFIFGT